jgi:isopenicillin N synthase-like dioxygenase
MSANDDVREDAPRIVDVGGLAADDARSIERVASEIAAPCAEWGVFHVVGHGISKEAFAAFDRAMRGLFALSDFEKAALRRTRENAWGYYDTELTKNRRDWKEVFDYGAEPGAERGAERPTSRPAHSDGVNRWPDAHPELREALLAYYPRCERVAHPS